MRFRSLEVTNIRSFRETERIEFHSGLNLLVGPNGGGKSNLLDICIFLARRLIRPWIVSSAPESGYRLVLQQVQMFQDAGFLEPTIGSSSIDTRLTLTIGLESPELDAITSLIALVPRIRDLESMRVCQYQLGDLPDRLAATQFHPGRGYRLEFINGTLQNADDNETRVLVEYLSVSELVACYRYLLGDALAFLTPTIYFTTGRASAIGGQDILLSQFDELANYRQFAEATSRSGPGAMQMALGRLVTLYRDMQEGRQHADPLQELKTLPQYQKLTKTLRELDFEWDLRCVNTRSNQYRLELKKANQALAVTQTSSGERELLNFVFGMFGLASEGCLLLIDEPELHLHPRWQRILLKLFQDFVSSTETQIIAATHSPSFITPESLGSIFRVFQQAGTSRVHRMHAASDLPRKSILALVNSHNNEKLFFADLVVLVEGISDRVVFEWLLRKADLSGRIVEVIEVHGKDNFTTYMRLLSAAQIPFAIVADRDYLARVGSDEIKVLFAPRSGKVASSLQHPDYGDAQVFIDTLDDAVKTGDLESLKNILGYVKLRHSRLLPNVATEQQQMLEAFIEERGKEHVYILKRGALEAYLIDQLRSKQLETLIHALATATKRSDVLDHEGEAEIEAIVQEIAILARNERG